MVLLFPFKKKIALLPVFISLFVILPEWSKGPDLRSGVFARVGSNPTDDKGGLDFLLEIYYALVAQLVRAPDC